MAASARSGMSLNNSPPSRAPTIDPGDHRPKNTTCSRPTAFPQTAFPQTAFPPTTISTRVPRADSVRVLCVARVAEQELLVEIGEVVAPVGPVLQGFVELGWKVALDVGGA